MGRIQVSLLLRQQVFPVEPAAVCFDGLVQRNPEKVTQAARAILRPLLLALDGFHRCSSSVVRLRPLQVRLINRRVRLVTRRAQYR
jgi:hypothetical protein